MQESVNALWLSLIHILRKKGTWPGRTSSGFPASSRTTTWDLSTIIIGTSIPQTAGGLTEISFRNRGMGFVWVYKKAYSDKY